MIKLQETNAAETPVDPSRINQSERRVWRQPTLTTWEVPEETQNGGHISGPPLMPEE